MTLRYWIRMFAGRGRPSRSAEEDERSPAHSLRQRLGDRRRLAGIILIALTGGLVLAFIYTRGELAGSDALAYWAGVHRWLSGEDFYQVPPGLNVPPPTVLPYSYPPWTLYVFLPWALIPWDIAWFMWRGVNIALFAGSVAWAYERRPLATGILVALLGPSMAANFDTGNINVFIALGTWVAAWSGPRIGGFLWALGTGLKYVPAFLIAFIPRTAWRPGLAVMSVFIVLSLATWPDTLRELDIALNYPRPLRVDYLLLLWGAVPWLWARDWPPRLSREWLSGVR